ncbi:MAG: hypothetical protein RR440_00005 [Erysipelotrichaceae bacterium]
MAASILHKWVKQYTQSDSFKEKDNLTPKQIELKKLEKENRQLRMENDILKQAALIMGRR